MTGKEIAKMIDHTLLAASATKKDISTLCTEAITYSFASVCVNPYYVSYASNLLSGSSVKVCTVIGFPLGSETTLTKVFATENAVKNGADEIDMVINIPEVKNDNFEEVQADIKAVVDIAKKTGLSLGKQIIVKTILETCYLTDSELVKACNCAKISAADFVKTSTGFGTPKSIDGTSLPNGASVHHVEIMRKTVGDAMGVKASGGIRTALMVKELIKAGASRIGTSSGVAIVQNWSEKDF